MCGDCAILIWRHLWSFYRLKNLSFDDSKTVKFLVFVGDDLPAAGANTAAVESRMTPSCGADHLRTRSSLQDVGYCVPRAGN